MKLVDYKNREIKLGDRVCIKTNIPSVDGMLYEDTVVLVDDFNLKSNTIRVTDKLGKIWWIESSNVSVSFL